MSNEEQIFIEREIFCPVCKMKSSFRYPNPRLFVAETRESDLHVTAYRWLIGESVNILPHYFVVWQCRYCLFADFRENVETPKGTVKDLYLKEAFPKVSADDMYVIQELRTLVQESHIDYNSAAALHLAALYIASLPDKENIDHNKLGRLSLRLGWLYREAGQKSAAVKDKEDTFSRLSNNVENIVSQLSVLAEAVGETKKTATRRAEELQEDTTEGEDENSYYALTGAISDKLDEINSLVTMLQRIVIKDSTETMEAIDTTKEMKATQMDTVLSKLRTRWPNLPRTEEQCLSMAIDAFNYSYARELTFQSIEQSMTIVRLIVDLLMRINAYERALTYIHQIYKTGMDNKLELQRRMSEARRNKRLTEYDEKMMNKKIATINQFIREAGETRRKIFDILIEKFTPKINEIQAAHPEKPAEQEKALLDAKVPEELIRELKKRTIIQDDKKKGKRIFSR
jgi:uncharacterized protein (DUF2225 family)